MPLRQALAEIAAPGGAAAHADADDAADHDEQPGHDADDATPPAEFPVYTRESLTVEYSCPICGYGWNGDPMAGDPSPCQPEPRALASAKRAVNKLSSEDLQALMRWVGEHHGDPSALARGEPTGPAVRQPHHGRRTLDVRERIAFIQRTDRPTWRDLLADDDDPPDFEEVEPGSPGVPRWEDLPPEGRPVFEARYEYTLAAAPAGDADAEPRE